MRRKTSWLYLLAVSQRQHKVSTQRLQVGLRLLQVRQGLVERHPRRPLLLRAAAVAASLPALLAQLAQGLGGAFYHLGPRRDTQLKTSVDGRIGAGKTEAIKRKRVKSRWGGGEERTRGADGPGKLILTC